MEDQRLQELLTHYGEIQNEVEALEANMRDIKRNIEQFLESQDAKTASVDGLATVQIIDGKPSPKYDDKNLVKLMLDFLNNNNVSVVVQLIKSVKEFDASKVDNLIQQMKEDGEITEAERMLNLRSETTRAKSIRITFKKG